MSADYLPRRPRYYLIQPDGWNDPLTYHYLGEAKLKRGDRVCIKGGLLHEEFGTVIRRARARKGYSYRVAKARTLTITTVVHPFPGTTDATQFSTKVEVG